MAQRDRTRLRTAILLVSLTTLTLTLAGCGSSSDAPTHSLAQLSGTLTADPPLALPPEAIASVRLLDVTRADAPVVIGEQMLGPAGQFPISFTLTYDRSRIVEANNYVVDVSIRVGRRVIWTSPTPAPALTKGAAPRVEVLLEPAS